jgi:hypothetical protein
MTQTSYRPTALLVLIVSLLGAIGFAGCASAPYLSRDTSNNSEEASVPRSEWLQALHSEMTQNLCTEDQIFRSCYTLSQSDCQQQAQEAAAICESEYEPAIPEALTEVSGNRWGSRIGKCTGDKLYQAVSTSFAANESESCSRILSEL